MKVKERKSTGGKLLFTFLFPVTTWIFFTWFFWRDKFTFINLLKMSYFTNLVFQTLGSADPLFLSRTSM